MEKNNTDAASSSQDENKTRNKKQSKPLKKSKEKSEKSENGNESKGIFGYLFSSIFSKKSSSKTGIDKKDKTKPVKKSKNSKVKAEIAPDTDNELENYPFAEQLAVAINLPSNLTNELKSITIEFEAIPTRYSTTDSDVVDRILKLVSINEDKTRIVFCGNVEIPGNVDITKLIHMPLILINTKQNIIMRPLEDSSNLPIHDIEEILRKHQMRINIIIETNKVANKQDTPAEEEAKFPRTLDYNFISSSDIERYDSKLSTQSNQSSGSGNKKKSDKPAVVKNSTEVVTRPVARTLTTKDEKLSVLFKSEKGVHLIANIWPYIFGQPKYRREAERMTAPSNSPIVYPAKPLKVKLKYDKMEEIPYHSKPETTKENIAAKVYSKKNVKPNKLKDNPKAATDEESSTSGEKTQKSKVVKRKQILPRSRDKTLELLEEAKNKLMAYIEQDERELKSKRSRKETELYTNTDKLFVGTQNARHNSSTLPRFKQNSTTRNASSNRAGASEQPKRETCDDRQKKNFNIFSSPGTGIPDDLATKQGSMDGCNYVAGSGGTNSGEQLAQTNRSANDEQDMIDFTEVGNVNEISDTRENVTLSGAICVETAAFDTIQNLYCTSNHSTVENTLNAQILPPTNSVDSRYVDSASDSVHSNIGHDLNESCDNQVENCTAAKITDTEKMFSNQNVVHNKDENTEVLQQCSDKDIETNNVSKQEMNATGFVEGARSFASENVNVVPNPDANSGVVENSSDIENVINNVLEAVLNTKEFIEENNYSLSENSDFLQQFIDNENVIVEISEPALNGGQLLKDCKNSSSKNVIENNNEDTEIVQKFHDDKIVTMSVSEAGIDSTESVNENINFVAENFDLIQANADALKQCNNTKHSDSVLNSLAPVEENEIILSEPLDINYNSDESRVVLSETNNNENATVNATDTALNTTELKSCVLENLNSIQNNHDNPGVIEKLSDNENMATAIYESLLKASEHFGETDDSYHNINETSDYEHIQKSLSNISEKTEHFNTDVREGDKTGENMFNTETLKEHKEIKAVDFAAENNCYEYRLEGEEEVFEFTFGPSNDERTNHMLATKLVNIFREVFGEMKDDTGDYTSGYPRVEANEVNRVKIFEKLTKVKEDVGECKNDTLNNEKENDLKFEKNIENNCEIEQNLIVEDVIIDANPHLPIDVSSEERILESFITICKKAYGNENKVDYETEGRKLFTDFIAGIKRTTTSEFLENLSKLLDDEELFDHMKETDIECNAELEAIVNYLRYQTPTNSTTYSEISEETDAETYTESDGEEFKGMDSKPNLSEVWSCTEPDPSRRPALSTLETLNKVKEYFSIHNHAEAKSYLYADSVSPIFTPSKRNTAEAGSHDVMYGIIESDIQEIINELLKETEEIKQNILATGVKMEDDLLLSTRDIVIGEGGCMTPVEIPEKDNTSEPVKKMQETISINQTTAHSNSKQMKFKQFSAINPLLCNPLEMTNQKISQVKTHFIIPPPMCLIQDTATFCRRTRAKSNTICYGKRNGSFVSSKLRYNPLLNFAPVSSAHSAVICLMPLAFKEDFEVYSNEDYYTISSQNPEEINRYVRAHNNSLTGGVSQPTPEMQCSSAATEAIPLIMKSASKQSNKATIYSINVKEQGSRSETFLSALSKTHVTLDPIHSKRIESTNENKEEDEDEEDIDNTVGLQKVSKHLQLVQDAEQSVSKVGIDSCHSQPLTHVIGNSSNTRLFLTKSSKTLLKSSMEACRTRVSQTTSSTLAKVDSQSIIESCRSDSDQGACGGNGSQINIEPCSNSGLSKIALVDFKMSYCNDENYLNPYACGSSKGDESVCNKGLFRMKSFSSITMKPSSSCSFPTQESCHPNNRMEKPSVISKSAKSTSIASKCHQQPQLSNSSEEIIRSVEDDSDKFKVHSTQSCHALTRSISMYSADRLGDSNYSMLTESVRHNSENFDSIEKVINEIESKVAKQERVSDLTRLVLDAAEAVRKKEVQPKRLLDEVTTALLETSAELKKDIANLTRLTRFDDEFAEIKSFEDEIETCSFEISVESGNSVTNLTRATAVEENTQKKCLQDNVETSSLDAPFAFDVSDLTRIAIDMEELIQSNLVDVDRDIIQNDIENFLQNRISNIDENQSDPAKTLNTFEKCDNWVSFSEETTEYVSQLSVGKISKNNMNQENENENIKSEFEAGLQTNDNGIPKNNETTNEAIPSECECVDLTQNITDVIPSANSESNAGSTNNVGAKLKQIEKQDSESVVIVIKSSSSQQEDGESSEETAGYSSTDRTSLLHPFVKKTDSKTNILEKTENESFSFEVSRPNKSQQVLNSPSEIKEIEENAKANDKLMK